MDALRLVYDDLVRERDRLRDARRALTSQLGPLPAASALIVGLFGAVSDDVYGYLLTGLFGVAVLLFLVIVYISARALKQDSYRELLTNLIPDKGESFDGLEETQWLTTMIGVERRLESDVAEAFKKERNALLAVQWLLVAQVLLLGTITVVASWGTPPTPM